MLRTAEMHLRSAPLTGPENETCRLFKGGTWHHLRLGKTGVNAIGKGSGKPRETLNP
jgi:hypothetical protein